jgi:hypothetical protein
LNVEYESEVFNLIKDTFGVDCQTELTENISIDIRYEVDESELLEEERSLLYFDGYEERFNKPEVENTAEQKNPENEETNTAPVEILHIKISKANNITNQFSNTHNSESRLYSSRSDKQKRQKGKYAEQLVYDTFINTYSKNNVLWISGNSTAPDKNDSCGYDMKYHTNDQENWRYLEVKSVSNNQFFLSRNEKEFAEQNREKYDFALVENRKINIVKFSEITDFDKMAVPNEFIVYYNIDT